MKVSTHILLTLLPCLLLVSSAPSQPTSGHQSLQPGRHHPLPRYVRGPATINITTFNIPPRQHYPPLRRPVPYASLDFNDLHAAGGEHAVRAAILSPDFRPPTNIHFHGEQRGRPQNLGGGLHGGGNVEGEEAVGTSSEVGHKEKASASSLREGQHQAYGKEHQPTYYQKTYRPAADYQSYHRSHRYRQHQRPHRHQQHQTTHPQQLHADQGAKSAADAEAQNTRRFETRSDGGHGDANAGRQDEDSTTAGQKDGNVDNDELLPLRQDDALQPLQVAKTLDNEVESSNSVQVQTGITVKQKLEEEQRRVSSEDKESGPQVVVLQSKAGEFEQEEPLKEHPPSHIGDYERLFPNVEWGNKIKPSPSRTAADDAGGDGTGSDHDETTTMSRSESESSGDDNEGMTSHDPGVIEEQKRLEPSVNITIVLNLESESSGASHDEDQQNVETSSVSTSSIEGKVYNASSENVPTTQESNASSTPSNAEDAAEDAISLSKKGSDGDQGQGQEKEVSGEVQEVVKDTNTMGGDDEKLTMNEVIHSANSEAASEINATDVNIVNQNLTKETKVHTEEEEAAQSAKTEATGDQNLRQEEPVAEMPEAAEEVNSAASNSSSGQLSAESASEEAMSSAIDEGQDGHGQGKEKEPSEKVQATVSETSVKDGKEDENQTTEDTVLSDPSGPSAETNGEENGAGGDDQVRSKEGEVQTATEAAVKKTSSEIDTGKDLGQEETVPEPAETANKSDGEANDQNTADETQDTEDNSREQIKLIEEESAPKSIPRPVVYFRSSLRPPGFYNHPYPVTHGYSHPLHGYSLPVTTYGIRKTFYREKNDGYRSVETHKLHHNYRQEQQASLSDKDQQENVQEPVLTVVRGGGQLVPYYMPQSYSSTHGKKAGEDAEDVSSREGQE